MKIRYTVITLIMFLSALGTAYAQELDPTVVVNKAYEGKLVQVHKPSFEMAVPDSVTKFNLDFDYLVSEQPYKGADGFTPYVLSMKPTSTVPALRNLYLKAGAGYTLYPTLDVVWSPFSSKSFKLDVYASHRSYIGDYRLFRPVIPHDGVLVIDRWRQSGGNKSHNNGYYDLKSVAGVDGRYETASLSAGFDVSYYGLASEDLNKKRMYDALDVKLGISSKPKSGSYFNYDVAAAYRFAEDKLDYVYYANDYLGEHIIDLDASLGQVMSGGHQILVDVDADFALYSEARMPGLSDQGLQNMWQVSLTPHYVLQKNLWTVDAGVTVSTYGQIVYPDIKASYAVIKDAMRIYAHIGGGNKLNTYASLLENNHHVDPRFDVSGCALKDVTVERINASVGIEGRIGSVFSYDLNAGYVNYGNAFLDAVVITPEPNTDDLQYAPGVGYASYQKYFASADWLFLNDAFQFDGNLTYNYAWGLKDGAGLFMPAALKGDVSFEYNWSKRIYAGVDCNFSTARKGTVRDITADGFQYEAQIRGYADVGVSFEYAFNRDLSIWARGGNLLNMTIQRNPLYAEKGINLTVGICLNL